MRNSARCSRPSVVMVNGVEFQEGEEPHAVTIVEQLHLADHVGDGAVANEPGPRPGGAQKVHLNGQPRDVNSKPIPGGGY
jgi:hypothetical protein